MKKYRVIGINKIMRAHNKEQIRRRIKNEYKLKIRFIDLKNKVLEV